MPAEYKTWETGPKVNFWKEQIAACEDLGALAGIGDWLRSRESSGGPVRGALSKIYIERGQALQGV